MAAPLSSADVEVALALCAVTEDARAAGVMRQLLLVFAVHARVGVSSFRALLQRVRPLISQTFHTQPAVPHLHQLEDLFDFGSNTLCTTSHN